MSKFQEISGDLLAIANLPPEKRNSALSDLSIVIQGWADYEMVQEQKDLISSIIKDLIAENDAEQIAKSKLVFVEDVEEQIAPTKKTRAKKVVKPVGEDLPDFIDSFSFVKDLPEPVIKLMNLRRKQDNDTSDVDLDATLSGNLTWNNTLEGIDFWAKINNEGDLREFKKLYGNKGEKVDFLIDMAEINEFVEGLSQPVAPAVASGDLPDKIDNSLPIKDLPEQIKKLVKFRNLQDKNTLLDLSNPIIFAFDWDKTPEGYKFWSLINDIGDLREFKRIYGNKGKGVDAVIDELIGFNELLELANKQNTTSVKTRKPRTPKVAPVVAPVVASQEVYSVELVIYPPSGGVLELKVFSLTELFALTSSVFDRLKMNYLYFNFKANTDLANYITKIELKTSDGLYEVFKKLTEKYDTFVVPKLNWDGFEVRKLIKDRVELNDEILLDAFKPTPKIVPVVTPKVVTPKVVIPKVVIPKVVTPKVVTPKTVKVVAPKVVKQKVTKPKVEDDLSFLDDLENIF
jgi:hypothetical protein